MKQSSLTRKTPLRAKKPMARSSRPPPRRKAHVPQAERDHMGRVAALGCVVCRNAGYGATPAEVHHTRFNAGAGQRSSNYSTIPLCSAHHRLGGSGVAFHAGPETWEAKHGSEQELLAQTLRELGMEE